MKLPKVNTTKYGLKSITYNAITIWNKLLNENICSEESKRNKLKRLVYNFYLNNYTFN